MQLRRCRNENCRRPYCIDRDHAFAKHGQRSGKLNCPHCGKIEAIWEDDAYAIHALTDEQEKVFNLRLSSDQP